MDDLASAQDVMSEMLDDPNPWRGMVFVMTTRLGWSGNPRPIWKFWDEFGMRGDCAVRLVEPGLPGQDRQSKRVRHRVQEIRQEPHRPGKLGARQDERETHRGLESARTRSEEDHAPDALYRILPARCRLRLRWPNPRRSGPGLAAGSRRNAARGHRRPEYKTEEPDRSRELVVPFTRAQIRVDGELDETCYRTPALLEHFVIAGHPHKQPPKTRTWLFWQQEHLIFAFDCEDRNLVAASPSPHEHDVDGQDRVEIFLWSGNPKDAYYCIEIGARGALHDYLAHFYRQFDDGWSLEGLEYVVNRTPAGYRVEGTISRSAMEKMGFLLKPGTRCRLGLFRADFASDNGKNEPTWITWIDAKGPKPDFHVAASFGHCTLGPKK